MALPDHLQNGAVDDLGHRPRSVNRVEARWAERVRCIGPHTIAEGDLCSLLGGHSCWCQCALLEVLG